jgi:hypothetical protein
MQSGSAAILERGPSELGTGPDVLHLSEEHRL